MRLDSAELVVAAALEVGFLLDFPVLGVFQALALLLRTNLRNILQRICRKELLIVDLKPETRLLCLADQLSRRGPGKTIFTRILPSLLLVFAIFLIIDPPLILTDLKLPLAILSAKTINSAPALLEDLEVLKPEDFRLIEEFSLGLGF